MLDYSKLIHILRYGTNAEQKFIANMPNSYDLLAINGNMVAHSENAIFKFILMNLTDKENERFFIDPITYAFQLNLDMIKSDNNKDGNQPIKKSIQKLLTIYGDPVKHKILEMDKVVTPQDFNNKSSMVNYCKNVIHFQNDIVYESISKNGLCDYIDTSQYPLSRLKPEFIIPPYFYLTPNTIDYWLDFNVEFIKIAIKEFKDLNIFAELVISKELLVNNSMLTRIQNAYKDLDISGILLWVDELDSHTCSTDYLSSFIDLIGLLSKDARKIFNLYGSFFSILLSGYKQELSIKLDGVGHWLEYSEHRSVAPVGGGIPTSKYYLSAS